MEIAILFVAIAAMATSLVVAWNIYLSPFRPKIFADTLMLHRLSGQDPLWIAVSILFVNAGSQGGLINDIAMSIQADEGAPSTQTLWRALHIINTDPLEWVRALGTADEERPEAWKSIYLNGKQQTLFTILFTLHLGDTEGFDQRLDLPEGQYEARIRINYSGKWNMGTNIPLTVYDDDVNKLAAGIWVYKVTTGADVPTLDDFEPSI